MRRLLWVLLSFGVTSSALAVDFSAPVQKIMEITERNWADVEETHSIFDEDLLTTLYSKSFIDLYREAARKSDYDQPPEGGGDIFGYDVITNSQDGCALKDISIAAPTSKPGVPVDIAVTFKGLACLDEPISAAMVTEVHFSLIEENGRAVIDDIILVDEGERRPLRSEMDLIIKGQ